MTAAQFKAARATLGLTPAEMAKAFGIGWRSVYRYEDGTRKVPEPVAMLVRLALVAPGVMAGARG